MLDPVAHPEPFDIFASWWEEQQTTSRLKHPSVCVLATHGLEGFPNARNVSLKEFKRPYFIVTSSTDSRKGLEIANDPRVALTFWWEETARQVRIQGKAIPLDAESANFYFAKRNKASQLVSTISSQGAALASTEVLERKLDEMLQTHQDSQVERPENWGGYKIDPIRIEFLEFKESRFHDRLLYTKINEGWSAVRLQP